MQKRKGTAQQARSKDVDSFARGDGLEAWGGIVSAHLEDWADELGASADEVLGAIETAGIEPVTDTAEPKGRGKDHDRPTDPALRCLALTRDDAQTLKNVLSQ
jgi:hypothetical protein